MKIKKLSIENILRLTNVEISPEGNIVLVTGQNEQGKSSVLEAIVMALGGAKKHPDDPVHHGADEGEIVIDTENWRIKRTFTAEGKTKLTVKGLVEGKEVTAGKPQALLDQILGKIGFDPLEFIRMGKDAKGRREQVEIIKKMVGLDFSDLDADIEELKATRSDVRKDKERAEMQANDIKIPDGTPDEEVPAVELTKKLTDANAHNAEQESIRQQIVSIDRLSEQCASAVKRQDETIVRLERELAEVKQRNSDTKAEIKANFDKQEELRKTIQDDFVIDPIIAEIDALDQTNKLVRSKLERKELLSTVTAKTKEYAKLKKQVDAKEAEKAKRLSEAKMPIEGLSVSDECVMFKGVPLSQEAGSMKLKVGMAVAMAENPDLKVIIMNGNELDDNSLKIVAEMAKEKDYQVWIESIKGEGEGLIIIEDGAVKGGE